MLYVCLQTFCSCFPLAAPISMNHGFTASACARRQAGWANFKCMPFVEENVFRVVNHKFKAVVPLLPVVQEL
eukprot:4914041-Amphidinium_carterae.6